jgi:LacI family transcriptional regulator
MIGELPNFKHQESLPMNSTIAEITTARDRKIRRTRRTKPVRLSDVAQASGVSIATVSMVVNDNPRISRGTKQRVTRFIESLGYRPNRAAQVLSGKRAATLAVLLPPLRHTFADVYFGELISGITDAASRSGRTVFFERATAEFVRDKQHVAMLEQHAVDGMLCLGFNDYHRFMDDFDPTTHAMVAVDSRLSRDGIDSVSCDYRSGAQQAMNYLLQLGHRKIGLIGASGGGRCTRDIVDAYRASMAVHGIRPGEGWIADGRFTEEGGDEAAEKILRRHPEVTALFAANDKMAIGAVHSAMRRGMSVPRDLSVVGFDNLRHAAFLNPPLTTIHLPLHEVGARACERLIERIDGQKQSINDRLPTHLVVRESTAMARDMAPVDSSAA